MLSLLRITDLRSRAYDRNDARDVEAEPKRLAPIRNVQIEMNAFPALLLGGEAHGGVRRYDSRMIGGSVGRRRARPNLRRRRGRADVVENGLRHELSVLGGRVDD